MKTNRHNAIGKCKTCKQIVLSNGGGRFVQCECRNFVDQERWSGRYVRLGGDMELLEQICPENCEHKEIHKDNKIIKDFEELKKYLKENYNLAITDK